jgi:hypothetical protein
VDGAPAEALDEGVVARWNSTKMPRMAAAASASRLAVGSSATSSEGRFTTARAIARRCCSPPESCTGWARSRASSPTLSSAARTRRAASRGAWPEKASGSITLSKTLRSCSNLWSWNTSPMLRRR